MTLKIAVTCGAAVLLLSATMGLGLPQLSVQPTNQQSGRQIPAKKAPQAKSKAEFDTYQAAVALSDPARLEASATDFAQKYPASELRPFLFQKAMALYQQADDPGKTLEMARAVLKYDSANPVALLTAARMLAERTHDSDLDRDARLQEASADAIYALQYTSEMAQPPNLSPEQFAATISQLRGGAHEVMATVAYKKLDYVNAIKEYNFAVAEEREHTDPVVWLRLAMAHDRSGEYEAALAAADKAVAASEPASPVHELAEKERARLKTLSPLKPAEKQSGNSLAPGSGGGVENF